MLFLFSLDLETSIYALANSKPANRIPRETSWEKVKGNSK